MLTERRRRYYANLERHLTRLSTTLDPRMKLSWEKEPADDETLPIEMHADLLLRLLKTYNFSTLTEMLRDMPLMTKLGRAIKKFIAF